MKKEQLKEAISNIKTWKKNAERAPHKPLLILYALSRVARGESYLLNGRIAASLPWSGDNKPLSPVYYTQSDFLGWHVMRVLRGPGRYFNLFIGKYRTVNNFVLFS